MAVGRRAGIDALRSLIGIQSTIAINRHLTGIKKTWYQKTHMRLYAP